MQREAQERRAQHYQCRGYEKTHNPSTGPVGIGLDMRTQVPGGLLEFCLDHPDAATTLGCASLKYIRPVSVIGLHVRKISAKNSEQ